MLLRKLTVTNLRAKEVTDDSKIFFKNCTISLITGLIDLADQEMLFVWSLTNRLLQTCVKCISQKHVNDDISN